MKNFINCRIQGVTDSKMMGSITHNIRSVQSRNDINDNLNYFYDVSEYSNSASDEASSIINTSSGTFLENLRNFYAKQSYGRVELNHSDRTNNKRAYQILKKQYNKDRIEHNKLYKDRRHQNLKSFHGSWAEGILTFSEAIHQDLGKKYTTQELEQVALASITEVCKLMNTELKYMVLHMSESVPHFHFHFKNYDDQGRSITHKHRSHEFLSKLQDISYKHLRNLGMDRGIKKEISGVTRYRNTKQWHEMEHAKLNAITITKKDQLVKVKSDLSASVELLQTKQDELKTTYTNLNHQKNSLKLLRTNHHRVTDTYKDLTQSIKTLQQEEKSTRAKWRAIKDDVQAKKDELEIVDIEVQDFIQYKSELKTSIKDYLKDHIKKTGNTYQVKNMNQFFKSLVQEFTEANSTNIKSDELDASQKKLNFLESKNKTIFQDYLQYQKLYNTTKESLNKQTSRVDALSSEINNKDFQLDELYSFLNSNDLKERFKKYLESRDDDLDRKI